MAAHPHKYARIERERRFLLDNLPPDLDAPRWIDDRYLDGTRFRLRRVTSPDPHPTIYKLTQKYQHLPDDLARVTITNTYLTHDEYTLFAQLPASSLSKHRFTYQRGGHRFSLDQFLGPLAGLMLAELEFVSDSDLLAFVPPAWLGIEVTNLVAFSGGRLCQLSTDNLPPLLAEVRAANRP